VETGWFGRVPHVCDHGTILIPIEQAGWMWGWPNRFLARMRAHGTQVMLFGRLRSLSSNGFSRLDTLQELSGVPAGFDGLIWTDQIRVIGPAVKARTGG
jgi:glycerophosphoryl diester phosphodiesterase